MDELVCLCVLSIPTESLLLASLRSLRIRSRSYAFIIGAMFDVSTGGVKSVPCVSDTAPTISCCSAVIFLCILSSFHRLVTDSDAYSHNLYLFTFIVLTTDGGSYRKVVAK